MQRVWAGSQGWGRIGDRKITSSTIVEVVSEVGYVHCQEECGKEMCAPLLSSVFSSNRETSFTND